MSENYDNTSLRNVINNIAAIKYNIEYNKFDIKYARSLSETDNWTRRMNICAYKMIQKYNQQLLKIGIDLSDITNPSMIKPHQKEKRIMENYRRATIKDNRIYIDFKLSRDEWRDELNRVRNLPGRQFHNDIKQWSAPINRYVIEKLQDWYFDFCEELKAYEKELCDTVLPDIKMPPGLELFPFQIEGIKRIEKLQGRALLGDEMGLGKTCQALMYAKIHPELRPVLIIVPATLKINWKREIKKWGIKGSVQILFGKKAAIKKNKDFTIINYDILYDNLDKLLEIDFKLLIADEIHLCKNPKTKRTKAFKFLAKKVEHIIPISGTPIINRPIEFWPILNILCPDIFNNFYQYTQKFCNAQHNGFGWDNNGASNTDELNDILVKSIMIRRLKKDVMKDLPPKLRSIIPMEISNRSDYDSAEKDLIAYINRTEGYLEAQKASMAETLVKFEKLKQLSVIGKMRKATDWIENFIEGDKLVVGCTHHFSIDELYEKFKKVAVKLDGRTSPRKKQEAVDKFQNDDNIRLFLGNVKAAGVGITLTESSNVAFMEYPWTPGECDQFEDRCHRIGTEADCVNAWYLVGLNTIEESIVELIDSKRKIVASILDGEDPDEASLVSELIKNFKEGA